MTIIITGCPPGNDEPEPTPTLTPAPTPDPTTVPTPTPITLPNAPSDLTLTNSYPCTIEWTDNADNEDGFRIYIGPSCADCNNVTNWTLNASVGPNIATYTWDSQSCCSIAECSCVQVRAYNSAGESASNTIMLAPVCK